MPTEPHRTPSEIARETLRRLAMRKLPPTPDNYRTLYHEIAGSQAEEVFPERALTVIASALPRETPEALKRALTFERAVATRQWPMVRQAVIGLCARGEAALNWGPLIRELVGQLNHGQPGGVVAQRLELLEHTLTGTVSDPEHVFLRLQGLARSWADGKSAPSDPDDIHPAAAISPVANDARLPESLVELLRYLLEQGLGPIVDEHPPLADEIHQLAKRLAEPVCGTEPQDIADRFRTLASRLKWTAEDQRAVRKALTKLLRLIIDNISELIAEDSWLRGQLELITEAFSRPLDIRVLDEVERRLREVIDKQSHLKQQINAAQERLKHMLAGFVDSLAELTDSTDRYHGSLEHCAKQIESASTLADLADVIEGILSETRSVQDVSRKSCLHLRSLRSEVDRANHEIVRLQRELDETSEMVRHDPLTGILNRTGLDEAIEREIARARRNGTPLCIAMLDIDNFKQLNDTFGHRTGDDALRHLAIVIREALRTQDLLGRYGGEEFLIVLPDADLESAAEIVRRLQRELTKRFFLTENQRLLITFSAGVGQIAPGEDPYAAIDRADKAMYAAKRAGKNRVMISG